MSDDFDRLKAQKIAQQLAWAGQGKRGAIERMERAEAQLSALKSERDALAERVADRELVNRIHEKTELALLVRAESAEKALAEMTRELAHLRREAGPDSCAALAAENAKMREDLAVQARANVGLREALVESIRFHELVRAAWPQSIGEAHFGQLLDFKARAASAIGGAR